MPTVLHVTLRYRNLDALFVPPGISPFSEEFAAYSMTAGIEYIAGELSADPSLRSVEATILLPRDTIEPDLEHRTREAVGRYCRAQLVQYDQESRAQRWHLTRELAYAVLSFIIFLGTARLLYASESAVLSLLGDGATIAGWVLFWFPVETLFFTVRHHRLDTRVYERLAAMQITIREDAGAHRSPDNRPVRSPRG
jgi:hypothetical protein